MTTVHPGPSAAAVALMLAACGGGGSGGGVTAPLGSTPIPVIASGTSLVNLPTLSALDVTDPVTLQISAAGAVTTPTTSTEFAIRTNATGVPQAFSLQVPELGIDQTVSNGSVTFLTSSTKGFLGSFASVDNIQLLVGMSNPDTAGMQYHVLGSWIKESSQTAPITRTVEFFTAGTFTPPGNIPTSSGANATFTGYYTGYYVENGGTFRAVDSLASAAVDFQNRTVAFSTNSSEYVDVVISYPGGVMTPLLGASTSSSDYNLSGTLTWSAGTNALSGAVQTSVTLGMSGTAEAKFFGPNAEELGGTLRVDNGNRHMLGAFSTKR